MKKLAVNSCEWNFKICKKIYWICKFIYHDSKQFFAKTSL